MKATGCYTFDLGLLGEVDVDVWFTVSKYYPATLYRANGDPGDPAEGGEVELQKVNCPNYPMLNGEIHDYLDDDQAFSEWASEKALADYEPDLEPDLERESA